MTMHNLILNLYEIQAVRFGSFLLKSGIESPIYVDLRMVISYPKILKQIAAMMWEKAKNLRFDLVCGVPVGAVPLATTISITQDIPMVMCRKEIKEYGTKKRVEGVYKEGQRCLLIEDVISLGASISETAGWLKHENLHVSDAMVVLDREQGGEKNLREKGLQLHSLTTLTHLVATLENEKKISSTTAQSVKDFLIAHQ